MRGVVVEDRGGGSCPWRHGDDDQAGDGFVAEVLCGDGEEGGCGATAFRLEEAANLGAVAELGVDGAEHDSHRRRQRGLLDERAVNNLAASGVIDSFEDLVAGCGRGLCRGEGAVACEEEEQRKREGRARDERDQGRSPVRSHPLAGSAVPRMEMLEGFYALRFELYKSLTWTSVNHFSTPRASIETAPGQLLLHLR